MDGDANQNASTSLLLLEQFRDGDDRAAEALFSRYFERLASLARSRLSTRLARRADPEDIVMSVYRSFFIGARSGRFALGRGGDLWRLLAAITRHKLSRAARHHTADRRSVERELPLDSPEAASCLALHDEPSPEDAVAFADELEWAFSRMDAFRRRVLELRLQGGQLAEIAQDTGRSERTVRRALAGIRELLAERLNDVRPGDRIPDFQVRAELATQRRVRARRLSRSFNRPSAGPPTCDRLLSHHDVLLQKMIGSGLTGKVYEAWQYSERREVAVKFLRKAFLNQPRVVSRFIDEAQTIGRLSHPNIVGVHGLGRTPGNGYFIVMELIPGPNLAVYQRQAVIPVRQAVEWTVEACAALEHAHEKGIIHCDLKPANLLLDRGGRIRVSDFGFARTISEQNPWIGELEGTAPFMAPEQASRAWGDVGIRTDVYGLGAVLFALLTGRPPWVGRRLGDILAQVTSAAPVVAPKNLRPDLPESVDGICRKCLSKAAADRYSTLEEVRSDLTGLFGQNPE